MTTARLTFAAAFLLVYGCARETPPYSVEDFLADRILLQATMVRCGEDGSAGRHDPNCVTAREAVDRIAAAEAKAKREALEAESERKREALRRARDAADERRRLEEEAERQRRQAEEFGTFESLLPEDSGNLTGEAAAERAPYADEPADAGVLPADEVGAALQPREFNEVPPAGSENDRTDQLPSEPVPEGISPTP